MAGPCRATVQFPTHKTHFFKVARVSELELGGQVFVHFGLGSSLELRPFVQFGAYKLCLFRVGQFGQGYEVRVQDSV